MVVVLMTGHTKMMHIRMMESRTILDTLAERAGLQWQLFTMCIYRQVWQVVCGCAG